MNGAASTESLIRIYLARHAQSEMQGLPGDDRDRGLTPIGREQARRMAEWLAAHHHVDADVRLDVAALLSGNMKRARETAAYASERLQLPVAIEASLDEAAFRVSDHLPQRDRPTAPWPGFVPSAEYSAFKQQAQVALGTLIRCAQDTPGPILAFTHSGLIKTLLRIVVGNDGVNFRTYNAAITLIEWDRGRWQLAHLNYWDHLSPELRTR